jgi:uracil-DNA glycosylase
VFVCVLLIGERARANLVRRRVLPIPLERRIHQRPVGYEIERCRRWLDPELKLVRPRVTVALGATAAWVRAGGVATIFESGGRLMQFSRDDTMPLAS